MLNSAYGKPNNMHSGCSYVVTTHLFLFLNISPHILGFRLKKLKISEKARPAGTSMQFVFKPRYLEAKVAYEILATKGF